MTFAPGPPTREKADYGLDAPGVVLTMALLAVSLVGAVLMARKPGGTS